MISFSERANKSINPSRRNRFRHILKTLLPCNIEKTRRGLLLYRQQVQPLSFLFPFGTIEAIELVGTILFKLLHGRVPVYPAVDAKSHVSVDEKCFLTMIVIDSYQVKQKRLTIFNHLLCFHETSLEVGENRFRITDHCDRRSGYICHAFTVPTWRHATFNDMVEEDIEASILFRFNFRVPWWHLWNRVLY